MEYVAKGDETELKALEARGIEPVKVVRAEQETLEGVIEGVNQMDDKRPDSHNRRRPVMEGIKSKADALAFDTQRMAEWLRQAFANVGRRYEISHIERMYALSGEPEFKFTVHKMHAGTCRQFADGNSWTVTVTGERNVAA